MGAMLGEAPSIGRLWYGNGTCYFMEYYCDLWINIFPYLAEGCSLKWYKFTSTLLDLDMPASSIGGFIISRWSRGTSPTADSRAQVQGSMVGFTAPRLHRDIMNPPILLLLKGKSIQNGISCTPLIPPGH